MRDFIWGEQMQNLLDTREKTLNNILSTIKLTSLFLTIILIINQSYKRNINEIEINMHYYITMSGFLICLLSVIYLLWYLFSIKTIPLKYYKHIHIIENLIFFALFTSLIILSNTYDSQYKFLYIFIVIISTLQLGMKYGIIMAIISSALQ